MSASRSDSGRISCPWVGAIATAIGDASATAVTDEFGDFWFEGLEVGSYALQIEATGLTTKKFDAISTEEDVNLGDIALA